MTRTLLKAGRLPSRRLILLATMIFGRGIWRLQAARVTCHWHWHCQSGSASADLRLALSHYGDALSDSQARRCCTARAGTTLPLTLPLPVAVKTRNTRIQSSQCRASGKASFLEASWDFSPEKCCLVFFPEGAEKYRVRSKASRSMVQWMSKCWQKRPQ